MDVLPNRLLPPVLAEPKADVLAFAAKPDVAVEPKPPKAEVVWFWLEPKPLLPKPPKPDMLMGRRRRATTSGDESRRDWSAASSRDACRRGKEGREKRWGR